MKHRSLCFLLAALSLFGSANAQIANPDTMVHRLFATLQSQDENAYVALYPNTEVMRKLMVKVVKGIALQMKQGQVDSSLKAENIDSVLMMAIEQKMTPAEVAKMHKGFARSFQQLSATGKQKGIRWSDARLTTYTYDTTAQNDEAAQQLFGGGLTAMKGIMYFTAGGKEYQMRFDKAMFLPSEGSWYGGEFKDLGRKGDAWTADSGEKVADTLKAPGRTQTKTKTNLSGTKTKTKSPAGKTKTKS